MPFNSNFPAGRTVAVAPTADLASKRTMTPGLPFKTARPANTVPYQPFASGNFVLMVFAVLLLANHLARPFEHIAVGLRIPAMICGLAIIAAMVGGFPAFRTKVGMAFAAFVGWMFLITPLSTWRGGSVTYLQSFLEFWVVLFMILACAPKTLGQLKFLANVTAVSVIVNIVIAGRFNTEGRFEMAGSFGNSDDAAILAGFAIPFWLFLSGRLPVFLRILVSGVSVVFLLRVMIWTGTRSILFSLFCLLAIWFARTTTLNRLLGTVGFAVALMGIVATTSSEVRTRLGTTLSALTITRETTSGEAADSAAGRRELLKDGIWTTITHPIWGVGPGQFGQYRWSTLGTPGKPKTWFKTHNTYVELSADNGIPGSLLYVLLMWLTLKTIRRVRKAAVQKSTPNLVVAFDLANCLEMALVFFAVTALFMTIEAHPYIFILAGMAVALERLVMVELALPKPALSATPVFATRPVTGLP